MTLHSYRRIISAFQPGIPGRMHIPYGPQVGFAWAWADCPNPCASPVRVSGQSPETLPVKSRSLGCPDWARTRQTGLAHSNPAWAPSGLAIWEGLDPPHSLSVKLWYCNYWDVSIVTILILGLTLNFWSVSYNWTLRLATPLPLVNDFFLFFNIHWTLYEVPYYAVDLYPYFIFQ